MTERIDPYAGEDPDEDYLQAEGERRWQMHLETEHGGGPCTCPVAKPTTCPAPF